MQQAQQQRIARALQVSECQAPYRADQQRGDRATGQRYARDPRGNQFIMLPNGPWQTLHPAR